MVATLSRKYLRDEGMLKEESGHTDSTDLTCFGRHI